MNQEQSQALRKPFEPQHIGKLPKPTKKDNPKGDCRECGGYHGLPAVHLDFVGHAAVTARLLTVDPDWTWEPMARDEQGLPVIVNNGTGLWIYLTISGVTRPGYGDVDSGKAWNAKELISDALRNAAMRFGVGLDLWSKSEIEHDLPPEPIRCRYCPFECDQLENMKPHLVEAHDWHWGDDGKVYPPDLEAAQDAAPTPDPATTPDPTPEPESTPTAPAESESSPSDGDGDDEDAGEEVTYEDFLNYTPEALRDLATQFGVTRSRSVSTLRDKVWAALVEAGEAVIYECPDCDTFRFNTEAEAEAHWDEQHGEEPDSAEDSPAATDPEVAQGSPHDAQAMANDGPDDSGPVPEGTLEVIRNELARLSGGAARSFADYRRKHGLGKVEDLTFNQACDLVDFLDKLPH